MLFKVFVDFLSGRVGWLLAETVLNVEDIVIKQKVSYEVLVPAQDRIVPHAASLFIPGWVFLSRPHPRKVLKIFCDLTWAARRIESSAKMFTDFFPAFSSPD